MNKTEQQSMEQVDRPEGMIIAVELVLSQSLLEDPDYDPVLLIAQECEASARAFYDDPACEYRYLTSDEYAYSPGPFAYRRMPGDLPKGALLMMGRVRVKRTAL